MTRAATRAAGLALVLGACAGARHAEDARVQATAVRELFIVREHARRLVVWADAAERGPTFDVLGRDDADVDTRALGAAIPVAVDRVTAPDLARLFRRHPDGWAAFYRTYPGAPGVVELASPVWSGDTLATVVVGRACGEHCLNAWRVSVRGGRALAAVPLRLPKS